MKEIGRRGLDVGKLECYSYCATDLLGHFTLKPVVPNWGSMSRFQDFCLDWHGEELSWHPRAEANPEEGAGVGLQPPSCRWCCGQMGEAACCCWSCEWAPRASHCTRGHLGRAGDLGRSSERKRLKTPYFCMFICFLPIELQASLYFLGGILSFWMKNKWKVS